MSGNKTYSSHRYFQERLSRFFDGIEGEGFYQEKDDTWSLFHGKTKNMVLLKKK